MSDYKLMIGDCVERLKELPDASIDAVVTDPPYGLSKQPDMAEVMRHWLNGDDYKHTGAGFMGKSWDSFVPGPSVWRECFRVLKPGGHLLAFFGSRTYDIGALAIRLAGFEVRDQIMWVYGSGFPKSLDVSKAIDKAAGAKRKVIGQRKQRANSSASLVVMNASVGESELITAPATEAAKQWQGWGTALKPAHEPIVMARKPISTTVAANVLEHGTGAINVDGCRVKTDEKTERPQKSFCHAKTETRVITGGHDGLGRFPANFIHDGSDEATQDLGEASRYFYCAKASKRDRDEGCENMPMITHQSGMGGDMPTDDTGKDRDRFKAQSRNHHPTVKPTDLMRYLVRMVTPPNGTVLDPFTGSGSTGKACMIEGFDFVGCELSDEYAEIAKARIEHAKNQKPEPKPQSDLFND